MSLPEHQIEERMQGPGGLAEMSYWWACSCGWETAQSVGLDGHQAVQDQALDHAEDGHTAGDSLTAVLTAHRLVAEGKAANLADAYFAQISAPDREALAHSIARLLISSARNRAAASESTESAAPESKAKPRTRRPSPSRLAKWEAQWQAEQSPEAER